MSGEVKDSEGKKSTRPPWVQLNPPILRERTCKVRTFSFDFVCNDRIQVPSLRETLYTAFSRCLKGDSELELRQT